ncbi:MAG: hypothetical protein RL839_03605 [Gammaproteobacteria bacterium]
MTSFSIAWYKSTTLLYNPPKTGRIDLSAGKFSRVNYPNPAREA